MTLAEPKVAEYADLKIRVLPETPTLGAVVEGVDAKKPLSPEVVEVLHKAILRYKVLFFRDQHLDRKQHQAFALNFGGPMANPLRFLAPYDEEGLADVSVTPHFHADLMYLQTGPSFSMLQMHELPSVGGDTMWADLVASFNDLSQPLRDFLEGLTGVHGRQSYFLPDDQLRVAHKRTYGDDLDDDQLKQLRSYLAPHESPLVRVIPETGQKVYWLSDAHTQRIKELTDTESRALLAMLFQHQLQPKYVYRWKWQVGDIAFWDQRTTLHSGVADFGGEKRFGQRQSVGPNEAVAP